MSGDEIRLKSETRSYPISAHSLTFNLEGIMKLGYAIPHEIRIKASANMGFIIKIGCGEFVAAHGGILIENLNDYLADPKKWEEDYNKLPGRGGDVTEVPRPQPEPSSQPETATDEARG